MSFPTRRDLVLAARNQDRKAFEKYAISGNMTDVKTRDVLWNELTDMFFIPALVTHLDKIFLNKKYINNFFVLFFC